MFTRYLTVDIITRSGRNFWEEKKRDFAKNVQPGQRRFGGEDTLSFWLTWRWEVGDCADHCRTCKQNAAKRCEQKVRIAATFFFFRSSSEQSTSPDLIAMLAY